jgi:hypothetical protein
VHGLCPEITQSSWKAEHKQGNSATTMSEGSDTLSLPEQISENNMAYTQGPAESNSAGVGIGLHKSSLEENLYLLGESYPRF